MAYQSIGRGTTANDGTGDDLRTGAGKVNANFVEVYTLLGDGSTLTTDTVTLNTATQTLTNKTITGTFTGNITGDVTGNVTGNVTGDLTGNVTGAVTGNVTGDLTGDVTGAVTGNVTGDLTGDVTGNVSTSSGNLQLTAATQIVEVRGDGSATEGAIVLNCETNAHGQTIKPQPHSAAVTNELLLPAGANSTLVSEVATQTLTNKTLTDPTITGTGAIAGVFTGDITGNVTGNVSGNVSGNVDGIVGGTTPAAGTFTDLTASGAVQLAVYADTTARDAAITSPAAGMIAFVIDGDGGGTAQFQGYDGSAWVVLN
jgi:hypothetical protein